MTSIKDYFYQGEYAQVLEKTYENRNKIDHQNLNFIVGSLSFLGRTKEAEAFYLSQKNNFTDTQKAYAYFFMAVGLTRRSLYVKAKRCLLLNRKLSNRLDHKNPEIKFLVEQGISFFLFYFGQFEKSLAWSQKALSSAMVTQDFWMKSLSYDLLANNLIHAGQIHEGLRHFEQAIKYSRKLKNSALAEAIEVSHLIFRCEYGIDVQTSFNELETKLVNLGNKDGFTNANLVLEYARQLTLRGDWALALKKLDEISALVYLSQNRRQEARLNLRWAEIFYLKNEAATALHYIRSGKRCLEFVDLTYEIQFLGLEIKIYKKLKKIIPSADLTRRLFDLSQKYRSIKNDNILSRDYDSKNKVLQNSDDMIHQFLLKASESSEAAKKIILETKFFSWIYLFFDVLPGEKYILLNLEPKSITCVTANGFLHKPGELTTLAFKILSTLSEGYTTKEELVSSVWGYTYDPLRHDSLIYSSFSSLRKIFGEEAYFIETSELGYKLKATVVNMLRHAKNSAKPKESGEKLNSGSASTFETNVDLTEMVQMGLNSRQIQIMAYLTKNQFICVQDVVKLFSTSEITANRDLRSLLGMKLVLRLGKGRATHYAKVIARL